jgi:hypothetical protein
MFEFLGSVRALGSGAINVASGVCSAVVSGAHTAYTDYTETGSLRSAATSGLSAAAKYPLTFTEEDLVQNALSFLEEKHKDHMLIDLIKRENKDFLDLKKVVEDLEIELEAEEANSNSLKKIRKNLKEKREELQVAKSELFAVVNFVNAIAALHDLVTGATVSNYTYARYRVIYNTPPSFDDLNLLRKSGLEDAVLDLVAAIELPPSGENIKIPKLGSINNAAWFFGYSIKNVEWLEELLTQGLRSAKSKAENILLNRAGNPKVNYVEFGIEQCAYAFIFGVIQGADQESQRKILSGLLEDIMKMIPAELIDKLKPVRIICENVPAVKAVADLLTKNKVVIEGIVTNGHAYLQAQKDIKKAQKDIKDGVGDRQIREVEAKAQEFLSQTLLSSLDILATSEAQSLLNNVLSGSKGDELSGTIATMLAKYVPKLGIEQEDGQKLKAALVSFAEILAHDSFKGDGVENLKDLVKAFLSMDNMHDDIRKKVHERLEQAGTLRQKDEDGNPVVVAISELVDDKSELFETELFRLMADRTVKLLTSPAFKENYKPESIAPMLTALLGSEFVAGKLKDDSEQELADDQQKEALASIIDLVLGFAGRVSAEKDLTNLRGNILPSLYGSLFNTMGMCGARKEGEKGNPDFRIDHLMGETSNMISISLAALQVFGGDEDFKNKISSVVDQVDSIDAVLKNRKLLNVFCIDSSHTQDMVGIVEFCNFLLQQQETNDSLDFIKLTEDLGSLLLGKDQGNPEINAAKLAQRIATHIATVADSVTKCGGSEKERITAAFNATMNYAAYFTANSFSENDGHFIRNVMVADQSYYAQLIQKPGKELPKFLSDKTNGIMTLEEQEVEDLLKDPAVWQIALESMQMCSLKPEQKMEKMKLTASIFKASMSSKVVRKMVFATSDQRVNALATPVEAMFALLLAAIVLPHLVALTSFVSLTVALAAASPYVIGFSSSLIFGSSMLYVTVKSRDVWQIYEYVMRPSSASEQQVAQQSEQQVAQQSEQQVGQRSRQLVDVKDGMPARLRELDAGSDLAKGLSSVECPMSTVADSVFSSGEEGAVIQDSCKVTGHAANLKLDGYPSAQRSVEVSG